MGQGEPGHYRHRAELAARVLQIRPGRTGPAAEAPELFTLAASWDFPADMPNYAEFGTISTAEYGTDANYQANYRLTAAFLSAHKTPFTGGDRIWIGGYSKFETDVSDYGSLLTSEGIAHTTETPLRWLTAGTAAGFRSRCPR